jgi:hypothetical protein
MATKRSVAEDSQQKKILWQRNWKWLIPIGALVIIAVFALLFAGLSLVFGIIKSSDVYKNAVAVASLDAAVQEEIGAPITTGFFVFGSLEISGSSGQADLTIPITGPNGKATIIAVAYKSEGQWIFTTLEVEIKTNQKRIDLLAEK